MQLCQLQHLAGMTAGNAGLPMVKGVLNLQRLILLALIQQEQIDRTGAYAG